MNDWAGLIRACLIGYSHCHDRFSVERLMQFLVQLGRDVEIQIGEATKRGPMDVRVSGVG